MTTEGMWTLLQRIELFAALAPEDEGALLTVLGTRTLSPGEVLCREGEYGDSMFVLSVGALSVRMATHDGTAAEIATIGPGETVGEMAFVDPAPRSATVIATQPSTVYVLDRAGLVALREYAPSVAIALVGAVIRDVTRRLREIEASIEERTRRLEARLTSIVPGGAPAAAAPAPKSAVAPPSGPVTPSRTGGFRRLLDKLRGVS